MFCHSLYTKCIFLLGEWTLFTPHFLRTLIEEYAPLFSTWISFFECTTGIPALRAAAVWRFRSYCYKFSWWENFLCRYNFRYSVKSARVCQPPAKSRLFFPPPVNFVLCFYFERNKSTFISWLLPENWCEHLLKSQRMAFLFYPGKLSVFAKLMFQRGKSGYFSSAKSLLSILLHVSVECILFL